MGVQNQTARLGGLGICPECQSLYHVEDRGMGELFFCEHSGRAIAIAREVRITIMDGFDVDAFEAILGACVGTG